MIEIEDVPQLSSEWHKLHMGVLSASNFSKIITSTGKPSTQLKLHAYLVAGEMILGHREREGFSSYHTKRGIALEPEARDIFMMVTGKKVRQTGFCFKDERKIIGCSPDGLIDPDSGFETKSPSLSVHIDYLFDDKLPSEYIPQVQGSMLVTGRSSWWFQSYFPGMPLFIKKIERDEVFISAFEKQIEVWTNTLTRIIRKLKEMN